MQEISDKEIVRLMVKENKADQAMRLLVAKYKERIYYHIRSILISHEDSHDVTQEVFIKAWRYMENFREDSSLYTWIYRIATNESLNFIRKNKKHVHGRIESDETYLQNLIKADGDMKGDEIQKLLQAIITKLPEKQRLIFNMRYYDHIKFKEIAKILDLTEGGVKSSYHLAEKKVREMLKEH